MIVYEDGRPLPWENSYRPLEDHPTLFQDFAELGKLALTAAIERHAIAELEVPWIKSPGYTWPQGEDTKPGGDPQVVGTYAEGDKALGRRSLKFVKQYGLTRHLLPEEQHPAKIQRAWKPGMLLSTILSDAYRLHEAVFLHKATQRQRADGIIEEATSDEFRLAALINENTEGVHIALGLLPNRGLVPTFTCDSLLSAIWLQFHQSIAGGRLWLACKGCGRLFMQTDSRQRYHDPACQNRSSVRRHAAKRER